MHVPAGRGRGVQVYRLVFDGPPETLGIDVVAPGPLAVHADLDLPARQHLDDVSRRDLAALSRVEDFGLGVRRQGFFQSKNPRPA